MRVLLGPASDPEGDPEGDPGSTVGLARLYAYPRPREDGCYLRANFVSTLDGSAAGPDGHSGSINDATDRQVFALLRALSDVVLVASGTATAEGYGRARTPADLADLRRDRPAHPTMAVVTTSGDLPETLLDRRRDAGSGEGELLVVTSSAMPPPARSRLVERLGPEAVLVCGEGRVDLSVVRHRLADRGLTRVLCEGGPSLLAEVARQHCLDELCLTQVARMIGGDQPRVAHGPAYDLTLEPVLLLEAHGTLLGRWRVVR